MRGTADSEDDAEEDGEDVGEADGADASRLNKSARVEYENEEEMEEEEEEKAEKEKDEEKDEEEKMEEEKDATIPSVVHDKVPEGFSVLEAPFKVMKLKFFRRLMYNEATNKIRVEFEFPPSVPKLLLVELAEKAAETVLVNSIQHINRCIVMEKDTEEDGNHTLQTEGVNFPVVWMYQHLVDVNKVYSNDIWKILETYGVEAARTAIITEIERVFDVYSISIDPRHLSLIADYMTQDGSYRPMNRGGLENVESPFQQMSFETTTHFLNNAVLYGNSDGMKTPSACIATGKVMKAGTGSFQIVQPLTVWRVCSTTRGIHVRMKALFEALKNPWVSVSAAVLAAYIYPVFFAIAGVFRNCQFFGRSGVRSVSRGVFHAAHVESDGQWQTTPRVGVGQ